MNKRVPPGPSQYLALKKSFIYNSLSVFDRCWKEHGDLFRAKMMPGMTWYLALHPEMVERVLTGHGKLYQRPRSMHKQLTLLFGEGLLTSEGEKWRRQRRMMQPAFHRQSLAGIAAIMTRSAQDLVEKWQKLPDSSVIDLLSELQEITLNIVGESLLGADLEGKTDKLKQSFLHCAHFVARRTGRPINLPVRFPGAKNREFLTNRETLDRIALEIIKARRQNANGQRDLLAMLIEARDADTGDGMTDQEIRDEVVTFLFAGHESVSLTLLWTFYLLSQHEDILQNLRNEADSALNGNPPGPEDFMKLPYARMVIEETLRLYPPAWFQPRQPITEDEIAGYPVSKKDYIIVSSYFTHRHPEFWP
ncbi:MAG TPA: cytochrome P450, partial [Blastocatellia bacterium]|nr:cytochrome P450 [Blastocatellia bacterium]